MKKSMWYLHLDSQMEMFHIKKYFFAFARLHITKALGELSRMIYMQSLQYWENELGEFWY